MTVQSFVYGLIWNKWTQGSALIFISGYMFQLGGWPLTKFIARTAAGWGAEVAGSGFFGHQARAIGALAKTTPGQIAIGAVAGYAIGATGTTIAVHIAEEKGLVYEGATRDVKDLYLSFPVHPIQTSKEYASVVGPAIVQQAATAAERKSKQSLREKAEESLVEFVLGPVWGPAYGFFRT